MYLGTFSFCYHCKLFVFMLFLFPRLEHPAEWVCARYKSLLVLLFVTGVGAKVIIYIPQRKKLS